MCRGFRLFARIFSLFCGFAILALTVGCSSSNDSATLPEVALDTIAPSALQVSPPEISDNLVDVNAEISVRFSELLDESSLNDHVKLISLKGRDLGTTFNLGTGSDDFNPSVIDERPISLNFSDYLYTRTDTEVIRETVDEDGVTEVEVREVIEEVLGSVVNVAPENERLSLWTLYSLELGAGIRDMSPVASISPVDGSPSTGNYISPFAVQFGTSDGDWQSTMSVNEDFALDTYSVADFDYASSNDFGAAMWIQGALVPSTFSYLYLRDFDQSLQSFSGGPERVDYIGGVDEILTAPEFVNAFSSKAVDGAHCFTWTSEAAGISSVFLRCRNANGYQGRMLLASHASSESISFLQIDMSDSNSGFVSYLYSGQYYIYAFDGANRSQPTLLDSISSDASVEVVSLVIEAVNVGSTTELNVAVSIFSPSLPVNLRYRIEHHTLSIETGSLNRATLLVSESAELAEGLSLGFDYLGRGFVGWSAGAGKSRNYYTAYFDTNNWLTKNPVLKNGEATLREGSTFVFHDGQAIYAWVEELSGTYTVKAQGVFPSGSVNSFVRPPVLTLLSTASNINDINVIGDREGNAFVYFNDGERASIFRFRQNIEWGSAWDDKVDLGLLDRQPLVRPLTRDGRMVLLSIGQNFGHDALRLRPFSDFD